MGYAESLIWNKKSFEKFEEIRNFPQNHVLDGKILYVIFLAVDEKERRKGIGSLLIQKLIELAKSKRLETVQLVAREGFLAEFYKKLGFKSKRELPAFLPYSAGTLMEFETGTN